jgi:hypothetical protein
MKVLQEKKVLDEKSLQELKKISLSSPGQCKTELIDFLKIEEQKLKVYKERIGIFIDPIKPKLGTEWWYFHLRKGSTKPLELDMAVGKMLDGDYKENKKFLDAYRSEKRFEEIIPLLTHVNKRKQVRIPEEIKKLLTDIGVKF